jgi:acylphosphatase
MIKSFNIKVSGEVQGVSFRAAAKERADELGIMGYVENLPDGSVHIAAITDEPDMNIFVHWCNHGPETARVDHLSITELDSNETYDTFTIRS